MKTRIKVVEKNSGMKLYFPQVVNDGFSLDRFIINIPCVLLFGKRMFTRINGLAKTIPPLKSPLPNHDETSIIGDEIVKCRIENGDFFADEESAKNLILKYIEQEKIKEEKEENYKIQQKKSKTDQKIKKVKYIKFP